MSLTPSQLEVYEDLKKYSNFPIKDRKKFPQLAHLTNPAERYKYFCEAFNQGEKAVDYKFYSAREIDDEALDFGVA